MLSDQVTIGEFDERKGKSEKFLNFIGIIVFIALTSNLFLSPYGVYVQFVYSDNVRCIKDGDPVCVDITLPCVSGKVTTLEDLNIPNIAIPLLAVIPPTVLLLLLTTAEFIIFNKAYSGSGKNSTLLMVLGISMTILVFCGISYIIMISSIGNIYYYQSQGCYQLNNMEVFEMIDSYAIISLIFLLLAIVVIGISMLILILIRKH